MKIFYDFMPTGKPAIFHELSNNAQIFKTILLLRDLLKKLHVNYDNHNFTFNFSYFFAVLKII